MGGWGKGWVGGGMDGRVGGWTLQQKGSSGDPREAHSSAT